MTAPPANEQVPGTRPPRHAAGRLQEQLLHGSLLGVIVRHGSFLALALGSHAAINLVDLWLIGRLGPHAVAGVHVATTVNFLPMIVGNGVSVASMAMMSRLLGAGRVEDARKLSERAFTFMLLLGGVLGVLLALLTPPCIDLQRAVGEARAIGMHYLLVANLGTVSMFALLQVTASMRSVGEVAMPIALVVGANLLNLALDVVLLFGWDDLGISAAGAPGAAYAAVLARTVSALAGVAWLRRRSHPLRLRRLRLGGGRGQLGTMLALGMPQSLQMAVRAGVVIALTAVAAGLVGEVAQVTLSVTTRLDTVVLFAAAGFASAATTVVGFCAGAGHRERARRAASLAAWCAFAVGSLCAFVLWFWARPLCALLVANAPPEVLAMGASYLGIAVVGHAFGCYALGATGGINGAGKTVPPLILDALVYLLVLPPALWLAAASCARGGSLTPLWWSITVVNVVLAVVHACYLRWARWI